MVKRQEGILSNLKIGAQMFFPFPDGGEEIARVRHAVYDKENFQGWIIKYKKMPSGVLLTRIM